MTGFLRSYMFSFSYVLLQVQTACDRHYYEPAAILHASMVPTPLHVRLQTFHYVYPCFDDLGSLIDQVWERPFNSSNYESPNEHFRSLDRCWTPSNFRNTDYLTLPTWIRLPSHSHLLRSPASTRLSTTSPDFTPSVC
jgi:hypothetical protein